MKCAEADKLLAMRLTGDLSPDYAQRLSGHLAECAACSAKAEEYDRLRAGLSSLQEAYRDLDAPFTFDPINCAERSRSVTKHVFILARVALATAAAVALVVVLWPSDVVDEIQLSVSPDGTGAPATVETELTVRVCRTPTIWLRTDQAQQQPEYVPVRVPKLPTLTQPPSRGVSGIRYKTPTLVTQKRRISRHDDSQSYRDHRNDVPVRDCAYHQFG